MCFGGSSVQQPQVQEQPTFQSQSFNDSLKAMQEQSQQQAALMQEQVAAQIAGIQQQTQMMQDQYEADLAEAEAAQAAADAMGAYTTITKDGEFLDAAQTTEALGQAKQEKKAKSTLKIGSGTPAAAGAGLNLGV